MGEREEGRREEGGGRRGEGGGRRGEEGGGRGEGRRGEKLYVHVHVYICTQCELHVVAPKLKEVSTTIGYQAV